MADDVATLAQIALAGGLVVATVALAWYTKVMAKAMWSQLDWSVRPIVAPSISFDGPAFTSVQFENVGNGVANDVRATVSSEPAGLELEWAYPSILPRQNLKILLPEKYRNLKGLVTLDRIRFAISCRDVYGYPRPQNHILEMSAFRASMDRSPTRYEETERELLEAQVRHLEEIAKQMSRLGQSGPRKS